MLVTFESIFSGAVFQLGDFSDYIAKKLFSLVDGNVLKNLNLSHCATNFSNLLYIHRLS